MTDHCIKCCSERIFKPTSQRQPILRFYQYSVSWLANKLSASQCFLTEVRLICVILMRATKFLSVVLYCVKQSCRKQQGNFNFELPVRGVSTLQIGKQRSARTNLHRVQLVKSQHATWPCLTWYRAKSCVYLSQFNLKDAFTVLYLSLSFSTWHIMRDLTFIPEDDDMLPQHISSGKLERKTATHSLVIYTCCALRNTKEWIFPSPSLSLLKSIQTNSYYSKQLRIVRNKTTAF